MDERELNYIQEQQHRQYLFQTTLTRCTKKSQSYMKKSKFFRCLNLIFTMSMIILSISIAFITATQENYIVSTISFLITAIQLLHKGFKIGSQGIEYRSSAKRIFSIRRRLLNSLNSGMSTKEIDKMVDGAIDELDETDLNVYSKSYGPAGFNMDEGLSFEEQNV